MKFKPGTFSVTFSLKRPSLTVDHPTCPPMEVEAAAKKLGFDFSGVDAPKNENDMYGLRYAEFVVPLVKAVQEQQTIIQNQQKQIDELKKLVEKLLK